MVALPAACMKCGAIFWAPLPIGGHAFRGTLRMTGNVTNCRVPGCGGTAQIADGVFQFTRGGIAVISAPDVTFEMLTALRVVLKRAHEQNLPIEEIKRQAEKISPAFGGLFTPALWSPDVKAALIMLLATIITALIALRQEPLTVNVNTIDIEKLINAIGGIPADRVIHGEAEELISEAVRPHMLGPPEPKPDDSIRAVPSQKKVSGGNSDAPEARTDDQKSHRTYWLSREYRALWASLSHPCLTFLGGRV